MAAGVAAEAEVTDGKGHQPLRRAESSNRKLIAPESGAPIPRFFLAKAGSDGSRPSFDRELASEAEAMIESLKSGLNYFSLVEYRAISDCSGKQPVVKKEPVRRSA